MNTPLPFAGQPDTWSRRRAKKAARLARIAPWMKGQVLQTGAIVEALQVLDGLLARFGHPSTKGG